ncbi:hypothetical protein HAX54_011786, partial [Datura stramonium]|nr:hypothetical protein [Datura stramonium]
VKTGENGMKTKSCRCLEFVAEFKRRRELDLRIQGKNANQKSKPKLREAPYKSRRRSPANLAGRIVFRGETQVEATEVTARPNSVIADATLNTQSHMEEFHKEFANSKILSSFPQTNPLFLTLPHHIPHPRTRSHYSSVCILGILHKSSQEHVIEGYRVSFVSTKYEYDRWLSEKGDLEGN